MGSDIIPEEEDERGDLYDDVDHPLPISSPAGSQPSDEIYEELPGIYYLVIHLRIVGLFFFFFFNVIKLTTWVENVLLRTGTKKIFKIFFYEKSAA